MAHSYTQDISIRIVIIRSEYEEIWVDAIRDIVDSQVTCGSK